MASSNDFDMEAQRASSEEERRRPIPNTSPSYQPVISDEDEESSGFPTAAPAPAAAVARSNNYYNGATIFVVILFCFLLATDVSRRIGWPAARRHPQQRWVPTADILNASGIRNLKFLGDVGDYGLQGLALDPRNETVLYQFHTLGARVMDLSPRTDRTQVVGVRKSRTYNGTTDFPLIYNQPVAHIGGVDLAHSQNHGTEIWIATHSDGIHGEGALWAVDPETLDVKTDRAVRVDYNLDWVAYHDGILYFGEFFNVQSVKRVSIDTLAPLTDLTLSLPDGYADGGLNYIQSASFDQKGRLVLLGDDYQCTVHMLDPATGALVGSQGLLLGSETDGITFDHNRGSMLVGFNRQHSHEQVMEQGPMISVIQLDLPA